MPVSRLRFQLAAQLALVVLAALSAVDFAIFSTLRRDAHRRFNKEMIAAAGSLARAVRTEVAEDGRLAQAAAEAVAEAGLGPDGFVVYDAQGRRLAARGPDSVTRLIPPLGVLPPGDQPWTLPVGAGRSLRAAVVRSGAAPEFTVVVVGSSATLRQAIAQLAWRFILSAPLVVFLALAAGYALAGRALNPLRSMTQAMTAIGPRDLDHQLPVRRPLDEVDGLAEQFNRLLARLADAQARNQRFLAQVAHQLKTPLTVIRGESALGLERPRSVEEHRDLLRRVSLAAEQMVHRVEDLFLLAQAEAGEHPPLTDRVELDGLVLECADLMRGRAQALGHRLELGTVDPAVIVGSEALVREAVLELLENACRHGDRASAIRISTFNGLTARVEVSSGGTAVPAAALQDSGARLTAERPGLGLSIARWIATIHSGRVRYRHEAGVNTFVLELATPASTS